MFAYIISFFAFTLQYQKLRGNCAPRLAMQGFAGCALGAAIQKSSNFHDDFQYQ